jgi:pectin methylesterase-like acyl-CoA thioesterase
MRHRWPLLVIAAALALPAAAGAQTYPEPKEPGKVAPKPKGPHHTYTVCKRGCDFRNIQDAVDKAKAGDKVSIENGTYREAVKVSGAKKAYLRIVGNRKNPRKVILDGRGKAQNGIHVDGADEVTIDGLIARDYKANGFFLTNVVGYTLNHLVAAKTGTYGLYAFNSKGGTMENSEAYYANDAARSCATSTPGARSSASARRTCAT